MGSNYDANDLEITIGDLVVAITDAALEVSENESEAYQIAGLVLDRVLRMCAHEGDEQRVQRVGLSTQRWLH